MNSFAAAGAGFLLAVLWFDLMFDVQTRKHPASAAGGSADIDLGLLSARHHRGLSDEPADCAGHAADTCRHLRGDRAGRICVVDQLGLVAVGGQRIRAYHDAHGAERRRLGKRAGHRAEEQSPACARDLPGSHVQLRADELRSICCCRLIVRISGDTRYLAETVSRVTGGESRRWSDSATARRRASHSGASSCLCGADWPAVVAPASPIGAILRWVLLRVSCPLYIAISYRRGARHFGWFRLPLLAVVAARCLGSTCDARSVGVRHRGARRLSRLLRRGFRPRRPAPGAAN